MKKLFALFLVVCCFATLAACGKKCEHQYEETITTNPTCSAVGIKTFTCSLCNDSYTEEIPMSEHTYGTATVTKAATCTEEGEESVACKVCGITEIVGSVPKLQHQYNSEVTKESTCTVEGTKTFTCATCSHTYTEEIAKINHTYTSKVTTEATCTNAGVKTYTCKVCSDSYTEAVSAKGHSYTTKTNSSATCTSSGSATHTCKACGDSYTETIAAKGHKWISATCNKAKYCSSCGITEGSALGHTTQNGTCTRCGQTFSVADKCKLNIKNELPHTATSWYSASGELYAEVTVEEVEYAFNANSDGTVRLVLEFSCYTVACKRQAIFGIKLYDSKGRLIATENALYPGATAGLYWTATERFYDLEPGVYTIEITPKIG